MCVHVHLMKNELYDSKDSIIVFLFYLICLEFFNLLFATQSNILKFIKMTHSIWGNLTSLYLYNAFTASQRDHKVFTAA